MRLSNKNALGLTIEAGILLPGPMIEDATTEGIGKVWCEVGPKGWTMS